MSMKLSSLFKFVLPPWASSGARIFTTPHGASKRVYYIMAPHHLYAYEVRKGNVILPVKHDLSPYLCNLLEKEAVDITIEYMSIRVPHEDKESP